MFTLVVSLLVESGRCYGRVLGCGCRSGCFVSEYRLWDTRLPCLWHAGLVAWRLVVWTSYHLGQGWNVSRWQLDSYPLCHQRAPSLVNFEEGAGSRLVRSQGLRGCSASTPRVPQAQPPLHLSSPGPLCMGLQAVE